MGQAFCSYRRGQNHLLQRHGYGPMLSQNIEEKETHGSSSAIAQFAQHFRLQRAVYVERRRTGLVTSGASELWLRNTAGVLLHVKGTQEGATLSLGSSCGAWNISTATRAAASAPGIKQAGPPLSPI
jgi:hypothetical protein